MDTFAKELSEKLALVYRNVTKLEEAALKEAEFNLSLAEIHLIDLLSQYENGVTVSEIASLMDITRATASTAVSNLVKKGYLLKQSLHKDGRKITVSLSKEGIRANNLHKRCQRQVITKLGNDFTEEQRDILLKAIDKLNVHFSTEGKRKSHEI